MHELAILALVVVILMAAMTATAGLVGPAVRVLEGALLVGSILVILFAMFFAGAEVLMRYGFNSPIPGHLEGSELLIPIIVFLAISYTQSTHGHVGMDLFLDALPPGARRRALMGTMFVSIFVCAVLAYFSFKNAYQLWLYDDVTMTPPYFRTWPSAAALSLGYGLIAMRMYIQVLHVYDPKRFSPHEPSGTGFHGAE